MVPLSRSALGRDVRFPRPKRWVGIGSAVAQSNHLVGTSIPKDSEGSGHQRWRCSGGYNPRRLWTGRTTLEKPRKEGSPSMVFEVEVAFAFHPVHP